MSKDGKYTRHVDLIGKEEFIGLFSGDLSLNDWFTGNELEKFTFPRQAGSLAARYLVKKRIGLELKREGIAKRIEILNDTMGKPFLVYEDALRTSLDAAGIKDILCSLSHSRHYITAMTIFCYEEI